MLEWSVKKSAAIANQRKCDSRYRKHADNNANVNEYLNRYNATIPTASRLPNV